MATVPDHDAFISYSHRHDRTLGPALQTSLERFAKPWRKLRMSRIYIDEANLAASPEAVGIGRGRAGIVTLVHPAGLSRCGGFRPGGPRGPVVAGAPVPWVGY